MDVELKKKYSYLEKGSFLSENERKKARKKGTFKMLQSQARWLLNYLTPQF